MNLQLNQIIWRKFYEEIELDKPEQNYIQSLIPIDQKGITIDLYVYSNVSRKMYYIHLFESQQDEEIKESLQLKHQLCRYDEKTKGLKLKSMRKIIESFVNSKPILTGIFDTKQQILRKNTITTFNIKLHWEPEATKPILVDDRIAYIKEEQKFTQKKNEVQKLSWSSYQQHQIETKKTKVIIIEEDEQKKIEFIKID